MNSSSRDLHGAGTAARVAVDPASTSAATGPKPHVAFPRPAQAWYAVFVLALLQMVNFLDRGILTLLVEPIKHDLRLTDTQMSFLMGFAFVGFYMLLALPIARLADYKSRRLIIGVGIAIYSLMTAFCGLARSFGQLFLCRIGVGAAAACGSPATFSMLADLFPREKLARAFAVLGFGASVGTGLSMVIGGTVAGIFLRMPPKMLPVIGVVHGWQLTLLVVGLPGALIASLMATVPEPKRLGVLQTSGPQAGRKPVPIKQVLAFLRGNAAIFVPLLLGSAFSSVVGGGNRSWGAAFYMRTFHWSAARYGLVQGLLTLTVLPVGGLFGAWLAERWARNGHDDANLRVVAVATILSLPAQALFPLMPTAALSVAISAVGLFFVSWIGPTMNAALQGITPNQMRGQITALCLFVLNVVGLGLGPTVVALLTDFFFHSEKLLGRSMSLGTLTLGALGALITCLSVKPYGRGIARVKALAG